ncbi:MAG: carboxylating nicotinate-nucleotide diphosphorylase [Methanoregulaceae archaeon]|nr:carboxylating nicotinate-nucleotide diphosphorylase [Methanoregulaceae archaeon]
MKDIRLLVSFIQEDAPFGDITSEAIIGGESCHAVISAKEEGVISGLEEAEALFRYFGLKTTRHTNDGDTIVSGMVVLTIEGAAKDILLVERTALNILGRMSGIATRTRHMVDLMEGCRCRIAATRKTAPGLRKLDKKAVQTGGGDPHRLSLSDGILIKDNHLALVPLEIAITKAKAYSSYRKIEVVVQSTKAAVRAAQAGADILLFDNMTVEMVQESLRHLQDEGLREKVLVELSGGITEKNIREYLTCDVDLISSGILTHSVMNFDFSLDIVEK